MNNDLSVVLVGIGGFGGTYANPLLDGDVPGLVLAGAVDPRPEGFQRLDELKQRGIPIYEDTTSCFEDLKPDLTVIASPIQAHCRHTCTALELGSHVLCEKPLAATVQEGRRMIEARDKAEKLVAIGYQWSFASATQQCKTDIMAGTFGAPVRTKTLVCWPRMHSYYGRNNWAGALKDANGAWVLDSPIGNATAHYLHNMLFLLGDTMDTSAVPIAITGELYRANDITNYDTGVLRARTAGGAEVLFYSTHASRQQYGPLGEYHFEDAVITQNMAESLVARCSDGTVIDYGSVDAGSALKLSTMRDAIRSGSTPTCTIEAALSHTICLNGVQESAGTVTPFPADIVGTVPVGDSKQTYAEGLGDVLRECGDKNALPSELGVPWAVAGRTVDLRGYESFPSDG